MPETVGTIEVVSDDVIDWHVPYPEEEMKLDLSPKFFVDAYEAELFLVRLKDHSGFSLEVSVTDPDSVLKLDRLTIALVSENRQLVVFSSAIESSYFNLECKLKIPAQDADMFLNIHEEDDRTATMFRFRCSFEMNRKFRRLPDFKHPLGDAMAHLFKNDMFSDCSLVHFFHWY